ncbi:hypothetical protein E2C01_030602 [Portunus trituberculatus]|uniref:Uncharacterized protein n=1 Tax=Portunus trituberculatus TaxID=210409 RepID=A0A5B7EVP9_PORTR|nr:hypothetical protein [Portunus trituberculatus]
MNLPITSLKSLEKSRAPLSPVYVSSRQPRHREQDLRAAGCGIAQVAGRNSIVPHPRQCPAGDTNSGNDTASFSSDPSPCCCRRLSSRHMTRAANSTPDFLD